MAMEQLDPQEPQPYLGQGPVRGTPQVHLLCPPHLSLFQESKMRHNLLSNKWLKEKKRKKQIRLWEGLFYSNIPLSIRRLIHSFSECLMVSPLLSQVIKPLLLRSCQGQSFKRKGWYQYQIEGLKAIMGCHQMHMDDG